MRRIKFAIFLVFCRLRLIANNVVGQSPPSEATKEFQTIQAPPAHPPRNVTVRAMSATELRVRWIVSVIITSSTNWNKNITLCSLYNKLNGSAILAVTVSLTWKGELGTRRVRL